MRKNSFKKFGLLCSPSSLYYNLSRARTLDQYFSYLGNFSSSVPHNSFLYQKSWWKVQVNVFTPQELGVCRESNEVNGEKNVLCSPAEKKNCLLWISSEKIVCISW